METYLAYQHYWWFIISLLCGILVFLLFVQGGQTLIGRLSGGDKDRKTLLINVLGHKWELTFTTLVTFGGAFFASFPLFYSTSFGGAFYVWMAILFFFVIQAVAYEYRTKPANLLGERTYETFLLLNGLFGTILLGTAVGTLFTGAEFTVLRDNIAQIGGSNVISQWQSSWRGLEAICDYRNVALGLAVFFLSRTLAIHYFYATVDDEAIIERTKRPLAISTALFLVSFLTFFIGVMAGGGYETNPFTERIWYVEHKHLLNFIELPWLAATFLAGLAAVLTGLFMGFKRNRKAIWASGIGVVVTVTALMMCAGFNNTAYYPSLSDMNSSLTISNSSSSLFTLRTMTYVSFLVPVVVAYIWYVWRNMTRGKESVGEIEKETDKY
ncbi:MAG: cytochrome d ubiquinol oxidase subunit II [Rikenellaceae bacterium]|nr:cytochrome d ubiquinol oxidase subunit II [Rikenellaceae bacterium]